jgi:hypothetical protein
LGELFQRSYEDGLDEWLWVIVYREGPLAEAALAERVACPLVELAPALARLETEGGVQRAPDQRLLARDFVVPLGSTRGCEALCWLTGRRSQLSVRRSSALKHHVHSMSAGRGRRAAAGVVGHVVASAGGQNMHTSVREQASASHACDRLAWHSHLPRAMMRQVRSSNVKPWA